MKKIIFVALVLQSVFFYAQQMGRGGSSQNQGQSGDQERPVFNSRDVSGIFFYEIEEVVETLKVKDEEREYQISRALRRYNDKIKEISFLNSKNFQEIDVMVNAMLNSSQNPSQKPPTDADEKEKLDIKGILEAVRKEVRANEEELNKAMEEILTKKQNKRWLKYQKKIKKSLLPKRPSRDNGSSSARGMNSRGGGGMNGGGMRR